MKVGLFHQMTSLILKMDKYIDPKYSSFKRRCSRYVGMGLVTFLVVTASYAPTSREMIFFLPMLGVFLGGLFFEINKLISWDKDRVTGRYGGIFHHDCDSKSFPRPGQDRWLKKRFIAHYKYTVFEIFFGFYVGWTVQTFLCLLIYVIYKVFI